MTNKELFEQFKSHNDEISRMLGCEVVWRAANKASRIIITEDINPKKRENWSKAYQWMLEKAILFKEVAAKFGK